MRIISGKFKGKTINYIKSNTTRPLKDSVKENIFNIITHSKNIRIGLSLKRERNSRKYIYLYWDIYIYIYIHHESVESIYFIDINSISIK